MSHMVIRASETEIGRMVRELHAATGSRLCIDEDCPGCGWPERWFDGDQFGCNKCSHRGEYRDT